MTNGLLLLHAFPVDASMWKPQLAAIRGELAVVAPNFPGFGDAPLAGEVSTMDEAAEVAAAEVAAAGLDRVVVCGLSMGGYVAFAFRRKFRDRVAGLVLANTRAGADDEAGRERRRASRTKQEHPMRRQAMGGTRYCVGVSRRRRNDSRGQVAAQEAHLSGADRVPSRRRWWRKPSSHLPGPGLSLAVRRGVGARAVGSSAP